jgi:hypothetical protein
MCSGDSRSGGARRRSREPRADRSIIRPSAVVAHRPAVHIERLADPPLAPRGPPLEVSGGFLSHGGRHHFLAARSRNIALSSIASARSFLQPGVLLLQRLQPGGRPTPPCHRTSPSTYRRSASLTPDLRHTSAVFAPASCSRSTAMICSSVDLVRFIVRPLSAAGLYLNLEEFYGLRSSAMRW